MAIALSKNNEAIEKLTTEVVRIGNRRIICSWPFVDVSRVESGGDSGRAEFSKCVERHCASSSHSQSRTRSRSFPCCSDFLPIDAARLRHANARQTSRVSFSFPE